MSLTTPSTFLPPDWNEAGVGGERGEAGQVAGKTNMRRGRKKIIITSSRWKKKNAGNNKNLKNEHYAGSQFSNFLGGTFIPLLTFKEYFYQLFINLEGITP